MKKILSTLKKYIRNHFRKIFLNDIYQRLNKIEYRSFNRRFYAIEQITEYLIGAQVPGDYLEFGVYKGDTFIHANKFMSIHFQDMRFFAFDSFQGLPKIEGIDVVQDYSSHFHEHDFACSEEKFLANLVDAFVDLKKVNTVKGWFDEILRPENADKYGIKHISAVWIDCDLYESTVPVLNFITPYLSTGSVIIFDDWRCFRNHPDFGEQRATREWLSDNPYIVLHELLSFGWNGIVFTVELKDS